MYFRFFIIISPWNLEKGQIPITKGCFLSSLVEISTVAMQTQILKFRQCIFAIKIRNYLPLEKGIRYHSIHLQCLSHDVMTSDTEP